MRRALGIVLAITLLVPASAVIWLLLTESGLHWAYQRAAPYLTGELTVNTLEGQLIGPITLKDIEYQHNGALVTAEQILLEWQPFSLLAAKLDINQLHIQSLNIVLPKTEKPEATQTQAMMLPEINLPWRVALKNMAIDGFSLKQNEQAFTLQQIRLNATTLFNRVYIKNLDIGADMFKLNISGELHPTQTYRHKLEINWQAKFPTSAVINGTGQLIGDMEMTRIKQHLSGPLQLTLDASVSNLLDQLNWQASIDVTAFDAAKLNDNWPAIIGKLKLKGKGDLTTATLKGSMNGNYPALGAFDAGFDLHRLADNSIQIDRLSLRAPANDTRLHARGRWMPGIDGGDMAIALHWQNLRWPLKQSPWFDSDIGSGWIEGNIHNYRAALATDRPWPQAPPSFWYASADGNLDGLHFHSLRVTTLDGEAIAKGQLNWSPHLMWQAQVSATGIDPAALWPQWPGQLDVQLTSRGRIENGQLSGDADISQLTGKLRNYPVSLRSRLGWRNAGLDIAQLEFQSGASQVSAQGRIGETLKLDWAITADNLAELYPQAEGQLSAKGHLSGPREAPMVGALVNGKTLSLPGYAIGTIDATLNVDLFRWQHIDIKLMAQALSIKGYAMQSLDIEADTRRLIAKAISEKTTALVEAKGEVYAEGWHGYIQQLHIQTHRFSNWLLKAPAAINFNKQNLRVDTLCLHNKQEASLCTSLQREQETWQTNLDISRLPLMLFGPWLPPDLKLDGVANATAELQFQAPDLVQGQAHIKLPAGTISYPLFEGEHGHWEYRGGIANITLNEKGLEAITELAMTNRDRLDGRITLPKAKLLALDFHKQSLQASARMNIHDLGLIEAIVPEVHDLQGDVELNLSAAGTLEQPKLSGHIQLLNGSLRIPRLGLVIDQLSLKSQSEGVKKLNFRLDARSGEGTLTIQGQTALDSSAGWPTELSIKGKQFEVAHIPEATVQVSPDLLVNLQKYAIDIKGDIRIPYAKLQPKDLTTAARVSKDAVIVGGEQMPQEKWSIVTRIRLTLGERVSFYGFGFEGRFGGSLLLKDEPGQLTTATGELSIVDGRYRAYGQRLDVEHGRLLYTGGPLSNPGLDLRAVRHVNEVTAGLKVRGSLSQPVVELFSIPAMGQTDALSYLLLGRPVENASGEEGAMMAKAALALGLSGGNRLARSLSDQFGLDEMRIESSERGEQASLVMGRYLSPRLYVSYGVGLIEAFNTFTVRYQITEKWQLKGESGEYQGADILYTIER